jgi:ABC-2 type transport system ATP-binding protein
MLYEQDTTDVQAPIRDRAPAISVTGLTKRFGKTVALRDISLQAETGTVTALLGPNGAGKTTIIRILATLLRPDAGTARICGYDVVREPERVRALVGLTGQSLSVDGRLSGRENLAMFGRLHRLRWPVVRSRSARLLDVFGLSDARKRAVKTYSGGMRRKLDLALSLMGEPPILFLDEPTTGLDPASRHALWEIIRGLVSQGTTVLLTTQYLDEADALAESVVFINAGQVVATGTPAEMKAQAGEARLDLIAATGGDLDLLTSALSGFQPERDASACSLSVPVRGTGTAGLGTLSVITEAARHSGARIERFSLREPNLDDAYFQLTGTARPGEARDKP